jgi:hypothetical protein
MDAIKGCVDEKYHKFIKYGCTGAGANSTISMPSQQSGAVGGIPYPPKAYQRMYDDQNLKSNVKESEKWDLMKFQESQRLVTLFQTRNP